MNEILLWVVLYDVMMLVIGKLIWKCISKYKRYYINSLLVKELFLSSLIFCLFWVIFNVFLLLVVFYVFYFKFDVCVINIVV